MDDGVIFVALIFGVLFGAAAAAIASNVVHDEQTVALCQTALTLADSLADSVRLAATHHDCMWSVGK